MHTAAGFIVFVVVVVVVVVVAAPFVVIAVVVVNAVTHVPVMFLIAMLCDSTLPRCLKFEYINFLPSKLMLTYS